MSSLSYEELKKNLQEHKKDFFTVLCNNSNKSNFIIRFDQIENSNQNYRKKELIVRMYDDKIHKLPNDNRIDHILFPFDKKELPYLTKILNANEYMISLKQNNKDEVNIYTYYNIPYEIKNNITITQAKPKKIFVINYKKL